LNAQKQETVFTDMRRQGILPFIDHYDCNFGQRIVPIVNIKEISMHDDRFEVPTREQLIQALDKLLETPRAESKGGWPEVSFERMHEMDEFFCTVSKAVFSPDPDGASVITWEMTHRAHHFNPAPSVRVPLRLDTPEKIQDAVRASGTLSRASAYVSERIDGEMSLKTIKV
jgi:hypothetical protein